MDRGLGSTEGGRVGYEERGARKAGGQGRRGQISMGRDEYADADIVREE
jgi:hypothetical protein